MVKKENKVTRMSSTVISDGSHHDLNSQTHTGVPTTKQQLQLFIMVYQKAVRLVILPGPTS